MSNDDEVRALLTPDQIAFLDSPQLAAITDQRAALIDELLTTTIHGVELGRAGNAEGYLSHISATATQVLALEHEEAATIIGCLLMDLANAALTIAELQSS